MSLSAPRLFSLAGAALLLTSCTTVLENGRPVLVTSSNIAGLRFRSPAGSVLEAAEIDSAIIHQAVGTEIAKGILSVGTAVATGGTLFIQ